MLPGTTYNAFTFTSIQTYIAIYLKHLRLSVLLVIFVLSGTLAFYVFSPPVYYARAMVDVKYSPLPLDAEEAYKDSTYYEVVLQMQSAAVIERAARSLGLTGDYASIMEKQLKTVQIMSSGGPNMVILVWPYNKELTPKWPQAIFDAYMAQRDESRFAYRQKTMESYVAEIARADEAESLYQNKISEFQDRKRTWEAQVEIRSLERVPDELVATEKIIAEFENIRDVLRNERLTNVEKLSLLSTLDAKLRIAIGAMVNGAARSGDSTSFTRSMSPGDIPPAPGAQTTTVTDNRTIVIPQDMFKFSPEDLAKLEADLAEAQARYDELHLRYLDTHPLVQPVLKELTAIRQKTDEVFKGVGRRYDLEYESQLQKRKELEDKMSLYKTQKRRYEELMREQTSIESTRLQWATIKKTLLNELETMEYSSQVERIRLQFVGNQFVSPNPISPNRGRLLMIALAAGLALAVAAPLLLEFLDHTVSDPEAMGSRLGIQMLGIVPRYYDDMDGGGTDGGPMDPNDLDKLMGVRLEIFRVIRANFIANRAISQGRQMILVTSSLPREGKSMTSLNLAMAFAQAGEKTLLIDADVRRGHQHRSFGLSLRPGFSDALQAGDANSLNYCRPTRYPNLDVITCGTRTSRFPELVTDELLTPFLNTLRDSYKRIIVDTTPVLGLAETHSLLPYVDGVLMVVWGGSTPTRAVEDAVNQLVANGATFYGFLLNQVDLSVATNYQRYYYYSTYYYSSYTSDEEPKDPDEPGTPSKKSGTKTGLIGNSAGDDSATQVTGG